jgi:hypothetical protein
MWVTRRFGIRVDVLRVLLGLSIVLAVAGLVMFYAGCVHHLPGLLISGVCVMALSPVVGIPMYLIEVTKESRALTALSLTYAVAFASWLMVWLLVPALHLRVIELFAGFALAVCALGLTYLWWRTDRKAKQNLPSAPGR